MKKWGRIEINHDSNIIELTIDAFCVFRFLKIAIINYPEIKEFILDFIGKAIDQAIMEERESQKMG